jgi:gliding motility-associated-like protein
MNKTYLFIPILFLSFFCQSQTPFCGTDAQIQALNQSNPALALKIEQENQKLLDYLKNIASNAPENATANYSIPIVVHVIAPTGALLGSKHNISDWEIIQGLEMINRAFANEGEFLSPNGVNTGISFCLARQDPLGNPTNGINRLQSNLVIGNNVCGDFSTTSANELAIKNLIRWDCARYINFWLVTDIFYAIDQSCGIGGFAYYPGADCNIDGVMMETRYWNKASTLIVAAHEIGHHLNLRHTFSSGCTNTDCENQGDYVCDTPPDNSILMSDCNANSCTSDVPDLPDDTRNYMDYSVCQPKHFTEGQKNRMVACLETSRKQLVANNYCIPITNRDISLLNYKLQNGTCDTKACPIILVQNNGNQVITQLMIQQKELNSGLINTTEWTGNLLPNARIEIQLNCLEIGLGIKKIEIKALKVNNQTDEFESDNDLFLQNIEFTPAVDLSLQTLDTAICGLDGRLLLKTDGGTASFIFEVNAGQLRVQSSPFFDQLTPDTYNFKVRDAKGCQDSLLINIPDRCPPCLGGILNHYAAVQEICQNSVLKVDQNFGFKAGMKVIIHQAKGASMDTAAANFGNLIALNGAGLWEINEVFDLANGTIQLKYALKNTYSLADKVQVVSIYDVGSQDVCGITAKPWDGNSGGFIALKGGKINLLGNIDATGKGFIGGQLDCCVDTVICGQLNIVDAFTSGNGGKKGEGIGPALSDLNNACKGRNILGGGGGNNHNAGGGGGGNGGEGGFGGQETLSSCSTTSMETRGEGGQSITDATINKRLFFGGGGGAGDVESYSYNYDVFPGGNGGGIVFIQADSLVSSGGRVISNGANVRNAPNGLNGNGGGGGGGSLFLDCNVIGALEFSAKGGAGGSVSTFLNAIKHGPGGGGGGGVIRFTDDPIGGSTAVTNGGLGGKTGAQQLPYGTTSGTQGIVLNQQTFVKADLLVEYNFIEKTTLTKANCTDNYSLLITPKNTNIDLKYAINGGNWQNEPIFTDLKPGYLLFSYATDCIQKDTLLFLPDYVVFKDTLLGKTNRHCNKKGDISITASGGQLPYQFQLNNGNWQNSGSFSLLEAGFYSIVSRDAEGCTNTESVEIVDYNKKLSLKIDSSLLISLCNAIPIYLTATAEGTIPYYFYSLDNQLFEEKNTFKNLPNGTHILTAKDEHGCISDTLIFSVLKLDDLYSIDTILTICAGDFFFFGGKKYTQSGDYLDTLQSPLACDSLLNLKLTVLDTNIILREYTICAGDSLYLDDVLYDSSGIFVQNLLNQWGCDSTITTIVNFYQSEDCRERDCKMYLPNAFSPNGDRENDVLEISSQVVKFTEIEVYDRWGNFIFKQKNDILAWNGQNMQGKLVGDGVYIYVVRGVCADGFGVERVQNVLVTK